MLCKGARFRPAVRPTAASNCKPRSASEREPAGGHIANRRARVILKRAASVPRNPTGARVRNQLPFLSTTRRRFIRLAAATGVAALAIDSTLIEPNRPRIVRREIALRRWPAGTRRQQPLPPNLAPDCCGK